MLVTERLVLRPFTREDSKNCFENWGADPLTGTYFPYLPVGSFSEMKIIINQYSENENILAVVEKRTGNIIGMDCSQ